MLTVEKLARIMHEELEHDGWGDIDPDLFYHIAEGDDADDDDDSNAVGLRHVLERTIARLEKEEG